MVAELFIALLLLKSGRRVNDSFDYIEITNCHSGNHREQ